MQMLAIGFELRLSSVWGKVKAMLDAGAIGEPRYVLIELWRRPYRTGSDGWRYDPARVGSWILEEPIHFFDFAILSALQVDRFGNINTVVVGDQRKPRVRGPGTVGISALCGLAKRFYVCLTRHDRSAFVPRVDFLCGPGHMEGGDSRERMGLPPGGPKLVLSPLGVFDFAPGSKAMRVKSISPGVTLEQIRDATAFDVIVEGAPPITTMPTDQELELLRKHVDRRGDLQRKFP